MRMDINPAKFPTPVLGEGAEGLYMKLYGEDGARFVGILRGSPDEIAVISRLVAYIRERKEG